MVPKYYSLPQRRVAGRANRARGGRRIVATALPAATTPLPGAAVLAPRTGIESTRARGGKRRGRRRRAIAQRWQQPASRRAHAVRVRPTDDTVVASCRAGFVRGRHRERRFGRRRRGRATLSSAPSTAPRAGVAQLAERQPSKLNVAGSNPVSRSITDHVARRSAQRERRMRVPPASRIRTLLAGPKRLVLFSTRDSDTRRLECANRSTPTAIRVVGRAAVRAESRSSCVVSSAHRRSRTRALFARRSVRSCRCRTVAGCCVLRAQ